MQDGSETTIKDQEATNVIINDERREIASDLPDLAKIMANIEKKVSPEDPLYPADFFMVHSTQIEDLQMEVVRATDRGTWKVYFRLTPEAYASVFDHLSSFGAPIQEDWLEHMGVSGTHNGKELPVCTARSVSLPGAILKVSQGVDHLGDRVRSGERLVVIETTADAEAATRIKELVEKLTQETDIFSAPEKKNVEEYLFSQYCWSHKLDAETITDEQKRTIIKSLSFEPSSIGYAVPEQKGAHERYEREHGEYACFCSVGKMEALQYIASTGGQLSTHDRYKRGLRIEGASSYNDLVTGGGDTVFTRIVAAEGINTARKMTEIPDYDYHSPTVGVVYKPEILDRIDFYAQNTDTFGSKNEQLLDHRLTGDAVLADQGKWGYREHNEVMFHHGNPLESVAAFCVSYSISKSYKPILDTIVDTGSGELKEAVLQQLITGSLEGVVDSLSRLGVTRIDDQPTYDYLIERIPRMKALHVLKSSGTSTINGIPVERFVQCTRTLSDVIDIAHGRTASSVHSTIQRILNS